ncbi:MAG: hypothetical protein MUC87_15125 [Bacteroidia bacterium]|jgi:hypothetical protein|nr:hypothetical protein [Bacteroidia bacterium]
MRWLLITLLAATLAGCSSMPETEQTQIPAPEKISFTNPKWGDTLKIALLKDSLQNLTGYLLGGDTFVVDTLKSLSEKYKGIKNIVLQRFIDIFTNEQSPKRTYPALVSYDELDYLVCEDLMNDTNMQWFLLDSGQTPSPIWVYSQNLDNERSFETIVEIDRSHAWKHEYRIYRPGKDHRLQFLGMLEATNRYSTPQHPETMDKRFFFAIREYGWGPGVSSQMITLYKIAYEKIFQVSNKITVQNHITHFQFTDQLTASATELNATLNVENADEFQVIYEYTLSVHGHTCENPVINKSAYGVHYKFNESGYYYEPKDPNKHVNLALKDEWTDLTPLFVEQIDRVRLKGTRDQKIALRNFRKENWKFPSDTLE